MTTIEEIPLDIQETVEDIQENIEEIQEIPEKVEEAAPKKRGRPAGAKNKKKIEEAPVEPVKAKPVKTPPVKTKPMKTIPNKAPKKRPVEAYSSSSEEEARPLDKRALAAEMLEILSQQRHGKANARRDHYATWFQ